MSESTATLLEELVRHGKGMLGSIEKWIVRERKKDSDAPGKSPNESATRS